MKVEKKEAKVEKKDAKGDKKDPKGKDAKSDKNAKPGDKGAMKGDKKDMRVEKAKLNLDRLWVDYVKRDQTKTSVIVTTPVYPQYVTSLLQQSLRNNSAALCCVACSIREDLHMGKWNKLLLNLIADFGKNFYRRSVKMLRLKSNMYISMEQLVSSFFIGDWKFTIKLEEALREKMDVENQCAKDDFESSMCALLKTGDCYILSCDDHNWALWMGDSPVRPADSNTTFAFDPHRYHREDPNDKFAKPKMFPSIIRYIHSQYMVLDILKCLKNIGERQKIYVLTKFNIESKQMITRNPGEKFEVYMHKHCPNAMGTFEKFFGVQKRKEPGVIITEEPEESSIENSVLERGSGFFLHPKKKYACCPEKQFCKTVCTVCKTDLKKQIFLESGLLNCKDKVEKRELDHNNYSRHPQGKDCWVLRGNHGLNSFRECTGNQGISVALIALKRIDRKKARSWDNREIDDIVKTGTVMFKEFCRKTCQFQRPTLLALCRCLGSCETWGGWHTKTVAWGGRPGLPALIAGLLSNNGRGLLQLPGCLDVAIWKDREAYYLFLPENTEDPEGASSNLYFLTISDMSSFLSELIPTTAHICVSRIDFSNEIKGDEEEGDKAESFKCICILKADVVESRYGLPAAVALHAIITATEISSEEWEKKHIEETIDRAVKYLSETISEERKQSSRDITLQDFPKLFTLEEFGVVEMETFNNVVRGSLQYSTEKSNVPNLKAGFENFFKEYTYGVLCCRGRTIPIWKTAEGNLFYIKYLEKRAEGGNSLEFCMLRVNSAELFAQYIESDLPASRDDNFYITSVHISITRIDPVSGNVKLDLKGGYNWLVENQIALLRSWECPKYITECSLPATMLFGCACTLLPPNKFTGHHLSSFVECSYDLGKRLKNEYRILNAQILDSLVTENITFGMHSFQLSFGPSLIYYFERSNRIDYSILPVARNVTPLKYEAGALGKYFERVFNSMDCQQIIVRINDFLVVSIWKLWEDGPIVLFQPQSFFPIPPILDIWRLDETVANQVPPPSMDKGKKGKKGAKPKPKKGGKKKEGEKEGPKPAISIYLYPTLKHLAKHIGTILPLGFTEGRLVAYPVRTKILSEVLSTTVNPDSPLVPIKEEVTAHPMPKIGSHFQMLSKDLWYLLGNNVFENNVQGIEKRDKDFSASVMASVVDTIESVAHWNSELLDMIVKFGYELYKTKVPGGCGKRPPFTVPKNFFVSDFKVSITITHNIIVGDMMAPDDSQEVYNLVSGLNYFFGNEDKSYGILMARNYTVAVWKMNFADFKRYKKAKEEYDYFVGEAAKNSPNKDSETAVAKKQSSKIPGGGGVIVYPDDFDVSSSDAVMVDVIKTGEVKIVKKPDKKAKKGKKGMPDEVVPEPKLALLPEPPSGGETLASASFKTVSSKSESEQESEVPQPVADVPTEIEKHVETVEEEDEGEEDVDHGEDLPIIEEITESMHDLGGSEEDESEEGSYVSPVLSYTTEESSTDSASSISSPAFSETFYPDDCIVFMCDPAGQCSPRVYGEFGKPAVTSFHTTKDLANFFMQGALQTGLGSNRFTLHTVHIEWRHKTPDERAASPKCPQKPTGLKDCRVGEEPATAYVHPGGGRSYLIASDRRTRKSALKNTICWCVAALVMHHLLDINLWSTLTLDDIDAISAELRVATERKIGNVFDKKDVVLAPEDVVKDFLLSKRQIHVDVEEMANVLVEGNEHYLEKFGYTLELFFKSRDPLGFLFVEDRPCCAMWKSKEPSKYFLGINYPKNHIIMYDTVENFITGYLTMMREVKECILNIKFYKVFVVSKNTI